ncbi:hypothetical protein RIF29_37959 [Crotalaria pallida]|uniref:Uncharacterized protein n=1 Tax=Crotalaria pallida TaxID=3830 RepID=A0AAN9DZ95_CROPI
MASFLQHLPNLSLDSSETDTWAWTKNSSESYYVSSAYSIISLSLNEFDAGSRNLEVLLGKLVQHRKSYSRSSAHAEAELFI